MSTTDHAGVDRIVDVDLLANMSTNLSCSAPSAVVSAYALRQSSDVVSVPRLEAMKKGMVIRFVYIYSVPQSEKLIAIRDVTACLEAGAYVPEIGLRVRLDNVIEAHEAMESSRIIGKIIIDVSNPSER